ncbi:methyltransferase domain-containing protein [Bacteriovoracaceae bacterium]|nr:methyltransferase domain-containing protein [Bacteriovoracaceae bacterium]
MKYYDMHEDAYKQLKDKKKISWDGEKDAKKLFEHESNIAIEDKLFDFIKEPEGKSAVDLGTGTGTCALNLARLGFRVKGYDLSPTAISMAKENAKNLGFNIDFKVADITTIESEEKAQLVVDSSLLHCLVAKEDRANFFKLAYSLLTDDGYLFLHTMLETEDMSIMTDRNHLFYEDHILYSTGPDRWDMEWQEIQGHRVFPHRWMTTIPMLEEEIAEAGFKMVYYSTKAEKGSSGVLHGWLQKA